jgi:hypothetical protein
MNICWTPVLDCTGQVYLLGVVGNIWTQSKYGPTKMTVRTFDNFWRRHERFEGLKDVFETLVIQLTAELLECRFLPFSPVGYKHCDQHIIRKWDIANGSLLFGIGRNATGIIPLP